MQTAVVIKYRITASKVADNQREQCSTELERQLEIVVAKQVKHCPRDCQTAEILLSVQMGLHSSNLANIMQQLTEQLARCQSTCSVVGGAQTSEILLK